MFSKQQTKGIIIDILGIVLILSSILLGWLPGPGGIPLFLIGLGLLAKNHTWASRLLEDMKQNGTQLFHKFFVKDKRVQLLFDILGLALLGLAFWFVYYRGLGVVIGSVLGFLGVSLLGANRERLANLFKRKRP